jgi:hypothetical protein
MIMFLITNSKFFVFVRILNTFSAVSKIFLTVESLIRGKAGVSDPNSLSPDPDSVFQAKYRSGFNPEPGFL